MSLNPLSRLEKFLAKIAGNYQEIQPISRLENFLDDIAKKVNTSPESEPTYFAITLTDDSGNITIDKSGTEILSAVESDIPIHIIYKKSDNKEKYALTDTYIKLSFGVYKLSAFGWFNVMVGEDSISCTTITCLINVSVGGLVDEPTVKKNSVEVEAGVR